MKADQLHLVFHEKIYEPREDSYLLAKAVEEKAFGKVLDLGTGSGIQGITAALKGCEVTFADIDENAISCARNNAKLNKVKGNFVVSDLFSNINEKFNTIIFNPPYLPSSPLKNKRDIVYYLDGGVNGRETIDRFLAEYKKYLLPKHKVLLVESSLNSFEQDVKELKAKAVGKAHIFFEDIVVLEFE
ncbi:MAG: HemK2/MTQ2 family protein methyltransferase [Candidatus Micrarchaeales archaeon]